MLKAIIFDMDGVLVGTPKYAWNANNKALNYFGVSIGKKENKIYEGKSLKLRVPLYEKRFGIKIDFEKFSEIFIKTHLDLIENEAKETKTYIQNIISTLKKKGLKIAVTSSARKGKVLPILKWLEINQIVDFILTSDDLENHKPHPEPYLQTLRALKVESHEALVIEDSPHGIASGKAAKIKVIALKTSSFDEANLKESDIIISDLEEILDIIERDSN